MARRIIKRKKQSGETWEEIEMKTKEKLPFGKPSDRIAQGLKLECINCKKLFTKEEADRNNPDAFWRYGICSADCHIEILGIDKDFKKLIPESIDWLIFRRCYPEKAAEMDSWLKRQTRKIIPRKIKQRKIIKRRKL